MGVSLPRDQGFALLTVLLFVGLASAMAVRLQGMSVAAYRTLDAEISAFRRDLLLDSALYRAVHALENRGDPLHAALRAGGRVANRQLDGFSVRLGYAPESGKFDLNVANEEVIVPALRHVFGEGDVGDRALARWRQHRNNHQRFAAVEAVLAPRDRFGREAALTREVFTVYTGQAGIDPGGASDLALGSLPGVTAQLLERRRRAKATDGDVLANYIGGQNSNLFVSEVPIYTVSAELTEDGNQGRREATVIINVNNQTATILRWIDIEFPLH